MTCLYALYRWILAIHYVQKKLKLIYRTLLQCDDAIFSVNIHSTMLMMKFDHGLSTIIHTRRVMLSIYHHLFNNIDLLIKDVNITTK